MSKCYLAGGWFTPHTKGIIDLLEQKLGEVEGLEVYSPRRDGTKLTPNEFGNTEVRRKVFQDNVDNILDADFVVASLDGKDGYLDTGTVWEVGFATAHGIPVIGFQLEEFNDGDKILGGVLGSIQHFVSGIEELLPLVKTHKDSLFTKRQVPLRDPSVYPKKVIVIGPDFTDKHDIVNTEIVSVLEQNGFSVRLVDRPSTVEFGQYADELFKGIDFVVAVVDDRHPGVAWTMGQAYARKTPIVSFTNHDYGVNLMLLLSIVRHIKGVEALDAFLKDITEKTIDGIEEVDYADVRAI